MHKADVTIEIPAEAEERLRDECPNLGAAVVEGFLVNLFRRRLLSRCELGRALGLDERAVDALLARHEAFEPPMTQEDAGIGYDDVGAISDPGTR